MHVNRILYYFVSLVTLFTFLSLMTLLGDALEIALSPLLGAPSYRWFVTVWVVLAFEVLVTLYVIHHAGHSFSTNDWGEDSTGFRVSMLVCVCVLMYTELLLLESTEVLV